MTDPFAYEFEPIGGLQLRQRHPGGRIGGRHLQRLVVEQRRHANTSWIRVPCRGQTLYYVGVKSETALAGEYGFLPVFSQQPFSQTTETASKLSTACCCPP